MAVDRVSVSVYNDGDLLDECLRSVREHCGDVPIQVVDGRYETFRLDAPDNSTDDTPAVAAEWSADYIAGGPYPRERAKHVDRVERAPDGERVLFLDADERLAACHPDFDDRRALRPRLFNAKVYSDSPISRWPRSFYPETVVAVNRWDAYLFDVAVEPTDTITIAHRHDLRDRDYREAKYARIKSEGREVRYNGADESRYYRDEFDVETSECPSCGRGSRVTSPATGVDGDGMTRVHVCLAGDGCYRAIEAVTVGRYRYLPDQWQAGLETDPERLQLELVDAGCPWAPRMDFESDAVRPKVAHWIRRNMEVPA